MSTPRRNRNEAIAGAILGCAIGDAIGLPYENLSIRRAKKLFGVADRHRFLFGRGMVSDDTEHTCMVAQALCAAPTNPTEFAKHFAKRLRWWLLGAPAGIGAATLRATLKLWCGFPPARSGVFSAGNGPAMRSAILGAAIDDLDSLNDFTRASTTITHTDPKAYLGAVAVAVAAWCSRRSIQNFDAFFNQFKTLLRAELTPEFHELLEKVGGSLRQGKTTQEFARELCGDRGVSGYVYRTVPVALHAWLEHPANFREAIREIVACGGDADTTAAIVGGIVGAGGGCESLPPDWLAGICEWPRSVTWMKQLAFSLASALEDAQPTLSPRIPLFASVPRNVLFVGAVFMHVFRRMLPPY